MVRDNRIKTYDFQSTEVSNISGTSIGYTGSNFIAYTDHSLNGTLIAIVNKNNNYTITGSLYLNTSGNLITIWSFQSGTIQGNINASGTYLIESLARDFNNIPISGTTSGYRYTEIPLFGPYAIIGSGIGGGKSGLGISLIYI